MVKYSRIGITLQQHLKHTISIASPSDNLINELIDSTQIKRHETKLRGALYEQEITTPTKRGCGENLTKRENIYFVKH